MYARPHEVSAGLLDNGTREELSGNGAAPGSSRGDVAAAAPARER
jgi:hypothetical protein